MNLLTQIIFVFRHAWTQNPHQTDYAKHYEADEEQLNESLAEMRVN
jgi:ubiquitin-protein ligase